MTKKLIAMIYVSLLLLIQPQLLLAQDAIAPEVPATLEGNTANKEDISALNEITQDRWEAVKSVPVGDEITVETRDGKKAKGRLASVTDTTLTLSGKQQPVSFDQPAIRKVHRKVIGGSRAKNTLIGTAIGTGVGGGVAAVLLAATGGSDSTGEILAVGMLVGAGVGSGIGALIGKGEQKVLIYEAK
ncbi:MAG: hypothetical protein L0220_21155 [Acidobacteria bacterium]|nr:hypothetical protein [Acidobacteriota bacterium]